MTAMRSPAAAAVLFALAWAAGCGGEGGGRGSAALPDAVAKDIPVYAPSEIVSTMGSESGSGLGDLAYSGMYWQLATPDPPEKVKAFYDATLPPGWVRKLPEHDPDDPGGLLYDPDADPECWMSYFSTPGAESGELVTVPVHKQPEEGKTTFSIKETVRKKKRPGGG